MTQAAAPQSERDALAAALIASRERFLQAVEGVPETACQFHPTADHWSILHCAEHVAVAERQMLAMWEKLAVPGSADRAIDQRIPAAQANRARRNVAPERSHPKSRFTTLADAVADFKANRQRTLDWLKQTKDDLRAKVVDHPLAGTIDGYQLVLLMAHHAQRHADQIDEIKNSPGYPAK